jgi:hypothetical protein
MFGVRVGISSRVNQEGEMQLPGEILRIHPVVLVGFLEVSNMKVPRVVR